MLPQLLALGAKLMANLPAEEAAAMEVISLIKQACSAWEATQPHQVEALHSQMANIASKKALL